MPNRSPALLGPPKARDLHEPIAVSLDDLVPADHFYRHLERSLDLSFVRDLVGSAYAGIGRPSIDPVVFFKLQLVLFFEGLRSERQLLRVAADRLSLRWYLGYGLTEPLPDHSSLTRIRDRFGLDVFRRFFEAITEQCIVAGLVWGRERSIDATKVAANASLESMGPRFAVEAHLATLFDKSTAGILGEGEGNGGDPGDERAPSPLPLALSEEDRATLGECAAARHDWIGEAGRPDRDHTSGAYRRTADFRASATDPDAGLMPTGADRTHPGDQDHYVVDGGRARIVLMALVAPAEVQENQPALDLLWRARFRWKLRPRQVTGDTKYGTVENIVAIEDQRMRAYFPLSELGLRPGQLPVHAFVSDAASDTCRCPGGAILRFLSQSDATHRRIYQAPASAGASCALRARCTTSPRGRRIGRNLAEADVERVRGDHATEPSAKALRKRQVWVEPRFAEAKAWHGLRRFRLRGLEQGNGEALLIAAGQNLKRRLSQAGWGRHPWPGGAAAGVLLVLAPAPLPLG